MRSFDATEPFQPDLPYVRELLHFYNDLVIDALSRDDIPQAEGWLAVLETIRSQLDLYLRTLQK